VLFLCPKLKDCVCRPVIPQLSEEETEAGIEEILQEIGE